MRSLAVTEASQIAEARRGATDIATTLGGDELIAGKVAIVASELATNLIKHGGGGELLLSSYEIGTEAGVQLIALDRGRGIANLQECRRDGYSSVGSTGHGLGAIQRQSTLMEVATWPSLGTAILARVEVRGDPDPASGERPKGTSPTSSGCVNVPKPGEEVCGDACTVADTPAGRTAMVVDGLGHGPDAAIAANEALRLFHRHQQLPVPRILEYLHAGLRPTRGAAVAIARYDAQRSTVVYGGIGNIAGSIQTGHEMRRMISMNGTAGHVARRIQTFDYPSAGGLLIMHSDGLTMHWSLERYPGITRMHPTLIAAVLYRDYARHRDDATVLVVKVEK
jgi:anti-sigma regulatory factor (Ser/Thr protein kinase)